MMSKRTKKYPVLALLSCIALLTTTLFPCNCSAKDSSLAKEKQVAHACCDENKKKSNNDKEHNDCDNCSGCIAGASCAGEEFILTEGGGYQSDLTPTFHARNITIILLAIGTKLSNEFILSTEPPGFVILSSSSLATFLHKWLV